MKIIKQTSTFLFAGLATLIFTLDVFAATIKVETARGKATVPLNPQKVVVLDVGVLDNLVLLGVIDKVGVIPQRKYLKNLKANFSNKIEGGTLFEPDFEAIAKYNPDLIIVAVRSAKQLDALSKIAPTIDMSTDNDNFIKTAKDRVIAFGEIFNKKRQAANLIKDLDKKVAMAKRTTRGKGKALLIMVNGNKLAASGAGGRFGWLHKDLGIGLAVEGVSTDRHGQPISVEFIKQHNPDWLLVFDRLAAIGRKGPKASDVLNNAIVKDTKAWKNKNIYHIDFALYLEVGGLTGINKTIDGVIEAFK